MAYDAQNRKNSKSFSLVYKGPNKQNERLVFNIMV